VRRIIIYCDCGTLSLTVVSLLLVLDEAHGGRRAHVYFLGLDPFVTHLAVGDILGVLRADLSLVVNFVAKSVRIVSIVDTTLAGQVKFVMGRLLRCVT